MERFGKPTREIGYLREYVRSSDDALELRKKVSQQRKIIYRESLGCTAMNQMRGAQGSDNVTNKEVGIN